MLDWQEVKRVTLWQYEDLIQKINQVLAYRFVQQHYQHTMDEAAGFGKRILLDGYLQNAQENRFISDLLPLFPILKAQGVQSYQDLIEQIKTREACEVFLLRTTIPFPQLIQLLNYLLRWVLPFPCPIRELLQETDPLGKSLLEIFKQVRIRSNLDLLEQGASQRERGIFLSNTGIAEEVAIRLLHRADIARLAYVRGKTVLHLCGGGYDTLQKIAGADPKQMEADMARYYQSIGKIASDFKAVIPLHWMIGGARILPSVLEF